VYSDQNIFDESLQIIADRYSKVASSKTYNNLSSWQAALSSDLLTLNVDNPDINSASISHIQLFTDATQNIYTYSLGSKATGFMLDGSNADPVQNGSEIMGTYLSRQRPKAPNNLGVN